VRLRGRVFGSSRDDDGNYRAVVAVVELPTVDADRDPSRGIKLRPIYSLCSLTPQHSGSQNVEAVGRTSLAAAERPALGGDDSAVEDHDALNSRIVLSSFFLCRT